MEQTDADSLRVAAAGGTLQDAQVICASLQAAGIPALISGEHATGWLPHMNLALNPRVAWSHARREAEGGCHAAFDGARPCL